MRPTALLPRLRAHPVATAVVGLFAALLAWVFWPAFVAMAEKWEIDPQYSHGYLVPVFSVVLLVLRRDRLDLTACRLDWRGLLPLTLGAAGYVAGGYLYFDWLTAGSFVLALGGLVFFLGGRAAVRWSWPAVAFLVFMLPLPYQVETALGQPLRRMATQGSTWVLQTAGFPAVAEGNVILLEHGRIAVVEACSGLSMLMTFAALSTGLAMVVRRPLVDRVVIVASAAPVAVAVNIVRISLNGVAMEIWGPETAHKWFHDQGGWVMMPLAIALLGFELWLLRRVFVEVPEKTVLPIIGVPGPAARQTAPAAS